MGKWILWLALFAAWQEAFAADANGLLLSLEDPYSVKWAVMDNPTALRSWALQQMTQLDPHRDPVLWAEAVAAYLRVMEPGENTAELRQQLSRALDIANQHSLQPEATFFLRITQMELQSTEKFGVGAVPPPDMRDQQFREKIQLAADLGLHGRKILLMLEWGQFMVELGRDGEGIKQMHEAMRDLNRATDIDDLDLMQAKQLYAAALVGIEASEKSAVIYKELEQFCDARKLRFFCLVINQDYSLFLLNSHAESASELALQALKKALAGAEELQNENFIASVSNSLVTLYDRQARHEEARAIGLRAMAIFEKQNNGVWLADTQRKLGHVYLELNQPAKALELLAIAKKTFPKDYYWDQAMISLYEAQAYKMLHQPQKAFEAMSAYANSLRDNASRNQSAEIAQSLTQINLELEEEQSRSLTRAEEFQKVQAERNAATRQEQENTFRIINGIWIASGFLVFSGVCGLVWMRQQNRRIIKLNRHLRDDILKRFLPPTIADKVANGQSVLDETPHVQEVTALFGRLVGLEHAIEDLGPRVTARLLESLMQAVTDISLEHNGCLDKLHRGSFLILFGAPLPCPVHEQMDHALRFAHAIQQRFQEIRENWPVVEGWRPGLAIGIHHGPALVGVFGGKRRADYTAVGQTINLAARIEGEAKSGDILVSESVAAALEPDQCMPLGDIRLKGISKAQKLFVVTPLKREKSAS